MIVAVSVCIEYILLYSCFLVTVSLATARCINPQTYKQTYTPTVILGGG